MLYCVWCVFVCVMEGGGRAWLAYGCFVCDLLLQMVRMRKELGTIRKGVHAWGGCVCMVVCLSVCASHPAACHAHATITVAIATTIARVA